MSPELQQVRDELKASIEEVREQLRGEIREVREEVRRDVLGLSSRLERAETTLLREFRVYARMQVTRTQAIETRLHELEQRVLDLESGGTAA